MLDVSISSDLQFLFPLKIGFSLKNSSIIRMVIEGIVLIIIELPGNLDQSISRFKTRS